MAGRTSPSKQSNHTGTGKIWRVQIDFQRSRLLMTEAVFMVPKVQFEKFSSNRLLSEVIYSSSWSFFFLWTVNIQLLIISSRRMKENVHEPRKPSQVANTNWQAKSNFSESQSQRGPLTLSLFSSFRFLCPVPNFKWTALPPMDDLDPHPSRWKIQLTCSSSCLHYNSLP